MCSLRWSPQWCARVLEFSVEKKKRKMGIDRFQCHVFYRHTSSMLKLIFSVAPCQRKRTSFQFRLEVRCICEHKEKLCAAQPGWQLDDLVTNHYNVCVCVYAWSSAWNKIKPRDTSECSVYLHLRFVPLCAVLHSHVTMMCRIAAWGGTNAIYSTSALQKKSDFPGHVTERKLLLLCTSVLTNNNSHENCTVCVSKCSHIALQDASCDTS